MKKLSLFVIALSFLATGCKKESGSGSGGGGTCTLSKTSLPGVYVITAATYQADAQSASEDYFSLYDACEKDDLFTIKNDGTLTTTEGATSCTPPSDPSTGNWVLNGSNFIVTDGVTEDAYTISEFKCNSFKLKYVDATDQSIIIITFTRK